jgi:D-alanine-D-alanine ligase
VSDIAVIFGGPSPEHDVSVLTGLQAGRALLEGRGSEEAVRGIYWSKTGDFFEVAVELEAESFLSGAPRGAPRLRLLAVPGEGFVVPGGRWGRERRLDPSAVVNCCHGGPGEDGTLQAALDLAEVAYSGPTAAGAALGMDKLAFGALAETAGIPALPRVLLVPGESPPFPGPYIVKPRYGGSSIGIEVVADEVTAWARADANPHLRRGGVVEPFRQDLYDLQVAVRSWPKLELSAIERPLRSQTGSDILAYQDKYVGGEGMVSAPRELPADMPARLEEALRGSALRAARLCGLRGVARFDFLSDGSALYLNEINTVPGSLAKYLWVEPELPFALLLSDLIDEARESPSHGYSSIGADGSALRSAGSISAKLA